METIVEYLGDVQFEVKARGHSIFCDQPVENGGADEAMSPPEFLLASLGTCAGYYAVSYLRAHSLATEGLRVRVVSQKARNPARLSSFRIEVEAPAGMGEPHHEGIRRAVEKCLIHNTLLNPPRIELAIGTPVSV